MGKATKSLALLRTIGVLADFRYLLTLTDQHICLPELSHDLRLTITLLDEYNLVSWLWTIHRIIRSYSH
jgi:hypothetical protein